MNRGDAERAILPLAAMLSSGLPKRREEAARDALASTHPPLSKL